MTNLKRILSKPVDIAFLVYFRFFAALLIVFEIINQLLTGDYLNYVLPEYHFNYVFFPWLHSYSSSFAYGVILSVIVSGIFVAIGWKYRFFSILFFLSNSLFFLMEKTEYVNHAYLYCLVTIILMFLPANRNMSVDSKKAGIQLTTVPQWMYFLLLFQISVVYFYGGIAKLHADWFQALAMKQWVLYGPEFDIVGNFFLNQYTPWIMSYGGIFFDLLIVPALLIRKTRMVAFIIACLFHLSNAINFGLATFPWFSIMMTALFFGPSFPRKIPFYDKLESKEISGVEWTAPVDKAKIIILGTYCVFQLLIPLRHFIYPGESIWTEEGHRFSWHMMLRGKLAQTSFLLTNGDSLMYESGKRSLTTHQYFKMSYDPELILDYAHYLRDDYKAKGFEDVKVYARSVVGLNGRSLQPLIDKSVDLASEEKSCGHYSWIMPYPVGN